MIKGILGFGALCVAVFEALGFETVRAYLTVLGIPFHLSSIPVLELASWAVPVVNAAPKPVLWLLSGLVVLSGIRFAARANAKAARAIYHYRTGKDVPFLAYVCANVFGETTPFFETFIPVAQVVAAALLAGSFFGVADTVGVQEAQTALTGHVYGSAPQADSRTGVHLETKHDAVLPAGIRAANARDALALLWLDDKSIYVAPIHSQSILDKGFRGTSAVERDTIAAVRYNHQWRPHRYVAPPTSSGVDWTWLGIFGLAFAFLAAAFVLEYRRQRNRIAALSAADGSELHDLQMPIDEAQAIVAAVRAGRDVSVTIAESGETRRIWLRAASIEHGLVIKESPLPSHSPAAAPSSALP